VDAHFEELTYRSFNGGRDREGWMAGAPAADQAVIAAGSASVTAFEGSPQH